MIFRQVTERWYGQGDETGGLHEHIRINPTCQMRVPGGTCGEPAIVRVNDIDRDPPPRYPTDMYWCPEHALYLRELA